MTQGPRFGSRKRGQARHRQMCRLLYEGHGHLIQNYFYAVKGIIFTTQQKRFKFVKWCWFIGI